MKLHMTIGIIGDSGAMGKWLRSFFHGLGLHVIGSSLTSKLSNRQVVEQSDAVIFAVSLSAMVPVIRELVPSSRPEQLWMDVGSRKRDIVNEMLKSKAEVVGLHPLFAPSQELMLENETVACCPARLERWAKWVDYILEKSRAKILRCEPERHDEMMRMTQNIPHAALLAAAIALAEFGCNKNEFLAYSTASSRKVFELVTRMLKNSPGVYADIQIGAGEEGIVIIDKMIESLRAIRLAMMENDREAFLRLFADLQGHFNDKSVPVESANIIV